MEFRDIDIVDIANNTGIQSIQLADNAQMHADQYSGINLGELIKDEELRGVASTARVTVSGSVSIANADATEYLDGINSIKIADGGTLLLTMAFQIMNSTT